MRVLTLWEGQSAVLSPFAASYLWKNVHIDGSQSTVGDGAAEGTGQGEAGVQVEAGAGGSRRGGGGLLDDGVDGRLSGGHCEGMCDFRIEPIRKN